MKVLMVNKFLYPHGGSETYIFKLGDCLKALGHEVEYFGMEHEGRCVGNRAEQYTADMDFHTTSTLTKLTYPLKTVYSREARKKMATVLEDFQPDVVHLNNFNYQLTPSIIDAVKAYEKMRGSKVKLVYTAHDYQLICPNHMLYSNGSVCEQCIGGSYMSCTKNRCIHGSKAKSLIGTAEASLYKARKTYRYIDTVICPSAFMQDKIETHPDLKGKAVTLHNFIDEITPCETEKEDYVLYFGRYSEEKGIQNILEATDIRFICAGSGDYEEALNQQAHITNVGFQTGEALADLIRKATCSVYPSVWYENCPFSVMESIMYGTPVVGAAIGGIPELIDEGETGFLFESGNTSAMTDAILKITQNPALAAQMHDRCLQKDFLSVEQYTYELLKIYEESAIR